MAARIEAPQRGSSRSVYEEKWAIFIKWCVTNQVDFRVTPVKSVADFLLYLFQDRKLQPSTIDGYRSAIADKLGHSPINFSKDENLPSSHQPSSKPTRPTSTPRALRFSRKNYLPHLWTGHLCRTFTQTRSWNWKCWMLPVLTSHQPDLQMRKGNGLEIKVTQYPVRLTSLFLKSKTTERLSGESIVLWAGLRSQNLNPHNLQLTTAPGWATEPNDWQDFSQPTPRGLTPQNVRKTEP